MRLTYKLLYSFNYIKMIKIIILSAIIWCNPLVRNVELLVQTRYYADTDKYHIEFTNDNSASTITEIRFYRKDKVIPLQPRWDKGMFKAVIRKDIVDMDEVHKIAFLKNNEIVIEKHLDVDKTIITQGDKYYFYK
jgi:hypothetical protein